MSILADVEKALDGLRQGFQADGADLAIASATESKVTIQLVGSDETCWECIVPPEQLRAVVASALRRSVGALETIDLIDPREMTQSHRRWASRTVTAPGHRFWAYTAQDIRGWLARTPGGAQHSAARSTSITTTAQSDVNAGPAALTAHDFLAIDSSLSDEERLIRDTVRAFVRRDLLDRLPGAYAEGNLPAEFPLAAGQLGLLGMNLHGYGCPGTSAVSYGLACMELEAGDSGLRSFVSVQGSLAMFAIWR